MHTPPSQGVPGRFGYSWSDSDSEDSDHFGESTDPTTHSDPTSSAQHDSLYYPTEHHNRDEQSTPEVDWRLKYPWGSDSDDSFTSPMIQTSHSPSNKSGIHSPSNGIDADEPTPPCSDVEDEPEVNDDDIRDQYV